MQSYPPENDDTYWDWSEMDKSRWEEYEGNGGYLKFYMHCRDASTGPKFLDTFPYKLSLGSFPDGTPLLPFHPEDTTGGQILVTESYYKLFNRIMAHRKDGKRGVVLTGQPGTGKSNFLKFMLAWLLSDGQVVLLCDNDRTYLFYRGRVYNRRTEVGFIDLPVHRAAPNRSVWAPIDVNYLDGGPPIRSDPIAWPIQASSPIPIRWRSWHKQFNAALWGMPLWNLEELIEGLYLSPHYNTVRGVLEKHLPLVGGLTAPKTGNSQFDAILEVLHLDRVREKAAAAADDSVGAPTIDEDENVAVQADKSQVTAHEVEQALRILVRSATEEFGFVPRDVYDGIIDLPDMRNQHAGALNRFDYSGLKDLINGFTLKNELDASSHRVVVVFPTANLRLRDLWEIDFKSVQIAEAAAEAMRRRGDQHMREIYDSIHRFPDGSCLTGRIFEEVVHHMFCEGSTLLYGPMISNGAEPPTFLTSTRPPTLHLSPFSGGRVDTRVDFKSELSNVTLGSGRYYVPAGTDNPLFDSFTVNFQSRPVVISVFQITISSKHEGSAKGYFHIRQLKTHVRKLLEDEGCSAPDIKVQYFLVCPDDGTERRWGMPAGWGEGTKNTHRGDVFCLRVPPSRLAVPRMRSQFAFPHPSSGTFAPSLAGQTFSKD